ncbi:MAG: glycosyltransferase family 2 protein [Planctomycetota bacterium]
MKRWAKFAVRRAVLPLGVRLGTFRQHTPKALDPLPSPPAKPDEDLPSIRIATPTLNQARFLEGAIRSVLDQGYPKLEYAVCDAASGDGSGDILDRYRDRLAYARSAPDGGQANAINEGLSNTSGEIMAWLNADDRLLPGSLVSVARFFRDHPEVDVVYGHRVVLDEDGRAIGRWILPPHRPSAFRWRDYVPQETMFWRSKLWDRAGGGLDESLDFAIDWELLLRFEKAGATFHRLPLFLGAFTTHASQKSIAQRGNVGEPEFRRLQHEVAPTFTASIIERAASAAYMLESAAHDWACTIRGYPRPSDTASESGAQVGAKTGPVAASTSAG